MASTIKENMTSWPQDNELDNGDALRESIHTNEKANVRTYHLSSGNERSVFVIVKQRQHNNKQIRIGTGSYSFYDTGIQASKERKRGIWISSALFNARFQSRKRAIDDQY
jgi:hypothetical protein